MKEIETLAEIALIEPHAAYAVYVHGFQHKFTFVMRTIPGIENHLKKLDDVITNKLIKNLFKSQCSELERKLFALPVKLGGLGIKGSRSVYFDIFDPLNQQVKHHQFIPPLFVVD